jgi:hypothetical protein
MAARPDQQYRGAQGADPGHDGKRESRSRAWLIYPGRSDQNQEQACACPEFNFRPAAQRTSALRVAGLGHLTLSRWRQKARATWAYLAEAGSDVIDDACNDERNEDGSH